MNTIVDLIRSLPDLLTMQGASPEQIAHAETELNTSFAPEYREYLSAFGCIVFGAHELTGICASPRLNVVSVTMQARAANPDIPPENYVIEDIGIDGVLIWQNPCGAIFQSILGRGLAKAASSLSDYLLACSRS